MRTTKLFIDNGNGYAEVDLYDNLDIPITYNVADIRDISKKDSNFSLTVKIPNTTSNAQLFDVIHDISRFNSTFELLKQYPAFIEVDNNRTFEGYFKLTKVVINDDREISYEGNLYSNVIEFMKRLGTTTLRGNADPADDLSFSEYTVTLTLPVENPDPHTPSDYGEWFSRTDMFKWDASGDDWVPAGEKPYGKDFYFAPIDKYLLAERGLVDSDGGSNPREKNSMPMFLDELTPFLFYKEILDKIFEWAGYSYVSDFIENTANNTTGFEFDHLVYPSTQYKVPTLYDVYSLCHNTRVLTIEQGLNVWDEISEYENRALWAMSNSFGSYGFTENPAGITTDTPYYTFTAPQAGQYSLEVDIPYTFGFVAHGFYGGTEDIRLNPNFTWDAPYSCRFELLLKRSGTYYLVAFDEQDGDYNDAISSSSHLEFGEFKLGEGTLTANYTLFLLQGDELVFRMVPNLREFWWSFGAQQPMLEYDYHGTWKPLYQDFRYFIINHNELDKTLIDLRLISDFAPGATFDPTAILNPKRKKTDFITDLIRKFNLYIEDVSDKKDKDGHYFRDTNYYPNVRPGEPILRIEPRDMFYGTGVVRDLTGRVDMNTVEFGRIDDYIYNILDFNDFNDQTYYADDYDKHGYSEGEFGEEIIVCPFNSSDQNKTEIKTNLGQTMCIRPKDKDNHNLYIECPSIFKVDNSFQIMTDVEWKDRMLFVHNLYPGGSVAGVYNYDFSDIWADSGVKYWVLFLRYISDQEEFLQSSKVGLAVKSYLWLSHLNVPFGKDTADLNFGWANWYYQNLNGTWVTNNNTYNAFYQQMVEDYNNPDSRLMKCKMWLKASDIRDLQLSDTILVNNVAYHINKISQWKNAGSPVDVELIKLLTSNSQPGQHILKHNNPPALPKMRQVAEVPDDVKDKIDNNTAGLENVKDELKEVSGQLAKLGKTVSSSSQEASSASQSVQSVQKAVEDLTKRIEELELRMGYKDGQT